jgi:Holliday junction resolvase
MRRAAKLDDNHHEVTDYLRKAGWDVYSTASLGHGFPDLIVHKGCTTALVEVKDGNKPESARKLTPDQIKFRENWSGIVVTALSGEDALKQLTCR